MADNQEISNIDLIDMIEKEKPVYTFKGPHNGLY
jgi:hypothetical protein